MKRSNALICLICITIFLSCSITTLKKGSFIHSYPEGDQRVIIENDSILYIESNVSMMYSKVRCKFYINRNTIHLKEFFKEEDKLPDTIPFLVNEIKIKSKNKLKVDGRGFKFRNEN